MCRILNPDLSNTICSLNPLIESTLDHTPHSSIIDITLQKTKKKKTKTKAKAREVEKKWYYVMLLAIYILTISEDLKVVGTF
jgi:hypothetical protein